LIIRHDDTEEVVHQRLRAYEEITGPVITHYRDARYHRVDGDRSPEEVLREIAPAAPTPLNIATIMIPTFPVAKQVQGEARPD
jgi:hypothetical protein